MMDLLERADPAAGQKIDKDRLRALIDERTGITAPVVEPRSRVRYAWAGAVAMFALVAVVALPALLRPEPTLPPSPASGDLGNLPGVENVIYLASGGVQTTAVDGDTVWAMTALAHELQEISASTGAIRATYPIDEYVEGVEIGGGYLWLLSYDNGGEVLRFDPAAGEVDLSIAIGGEPWGGADWFSDRLWVTNQHGELVQIDSDGEILATEPGELKGEGLGYHWVNDPGTGIISSLSDDGTRGEIVIPTDGTTAPLGSEIRGITEAGGYLWLMDDDFPNGSAVTRFDPASGEMERVEVTAGLLGMGEFDGALWVASNTAHTLARIDPDTSDLSFYPMPGKSGGVFEADGALWVSLYHPGALLRLDTGADLIQRGEPVLEVIEDGHRLLCTGASGEGRPTVLFHPVEWIDYGSWSVIQAKLASEGYGSCAFGYTPDDATPAVRAADLAAALDTEGIEGPFVVAANGDGVHAARVFAEGREDVVGLVLVDPMPVGFSDFIIDQLGTDDAVPSNDLDQASADALSDFGDLPIVVIGQDPEATYLSPAFVEYAGEETATAINDFWQSGLDFYQGLSTDAQRVTAVGDADVYILWNDPDLVVDQILDVIERAGR